MKYVSSFLKWSFVIVVPLISVGLIVDAAYMVWDSWGDPKKLFGAFVLVTIGFAVWHNEGGFIGFRPSEIKAFLRNWDRPW